MEIDISGVEDIMWTDNASQVDMLFYKPYHTSNRYRRSMNQVLEDWSGGTYYAYRI